MQKSYGIGVAALSALAFLAAAPAAIADSESFGPIVFGPTLTDFGGVRSTATINVPQFNPSLGTLNSITFTLGTSFTSTLTITNSGVTSSSGTARTEVLDAVTDGTIDNSTGGVLNVVGGVFDTGDDVLGPAKSYSLGAGDSTTANESKTSSASNDYFKGPDDAVLALFTGTGNTVLNVGTDTQTVVGNTGGNTAASQVTTATMTSSITYNFTDAAPSGTPEPGTWGLLCAGSTGGLVVLRRRRARK